MRYVFLFLLVLSLLSPAIRSQEDVRHQLDQVDLLEKKGQYEQAIRSLRSVIDTISPSAIGTMGRAWTLLAIAHEDEGHYQKAQSAYEQALHVLGGDPRYLSEYAEALTFFAGFNEFAQRQEVANKLFTKALKIHEQLGNHRAIAMDCGYLAEDEGRKKHVRAAKKFLQQAFAEAALAPVFTDQDSEFLANAQGWVAHVDGDTKAEIVAYLRSLEFARQNCDGACPRTGWAYLFLGNAYADSKDWVQAATNMRQGLALLSQTIGQKNPQFLAGETLFAKVLEHQGMRDEASQLRSHAETRLKELQNEECVACTVSVAGLR